MVGSYSKAHTFNRGWESGIIHQWFQPFTKFICPINQVNRWIRATSNTHAQNSGLGEKL
jgi:hypothetical protein